MLLWPPPFELTDHLVLWYAGHLVASGGSPYDAAAWLDAAARTGSPHLAELVAGGGAARLWPYPPWTALLFVPFGLLPVEAGTWTLHLAYVASGLAAAWLLAVRIRWRRESSALASLALFAAFEPFVVAARWGQFSGFLLLGAALVYAGLERRRDAPLVAGALLLATKPHVTVFLAAAAAAWLLKHRRTRSLTLTLGSLLALGALASWREPGWLDVAMPAAADRVAALGRFGSPAALLIPGAGVLWPWLAVATATGVVACCAIAWRLTPSDLRVLALVAIGAVTSLALTPYALVYDQLLLAPAAFFAMAALDRSAGAPRWAHGVAVLLVTSVAPWLAYFVVIRSDTQAAAGLLPLLFAALLVPSAALLRASPKVAPGADQRHMPEDDRGGEEGEEHGGESLRRIPADERER